MFGSRKSSSSDPSPYSYRQDSSVSHFPDDHPIIIFDGLCVLCSGWVNFALRHDRRMLYRLLPAQSGLGHALYVHYGLDPRNYETNILLSDGMAYFKAEAGIRIMEGLGFPWSLAALLRLLPRSVRDWLYDRLARNRFRIFGRRASCYVPGTQYQERFLG